MMVFFARMQLKKYKQMKGKYKKTARKEEYPLAVIAIRWSFP